VNCVYINLVPLYVVGSYTQTCGGCDTIPTQDWMCSLVRYWSQFGNVLFEGLLMSHLFARYKALCGELTSYGERYIWAFLDTPIEVCIERTKQRRLVRSDDREFDPQNTVKKYNDILRVIPKTRACGFDVRMIDHTKDTIEQILAILREETRFKFETSYREESFR